LEFKEGILGLGTKKKLESLEPFFQKGRVKRGEKLRGFQLPILKIFKPLFGWQNFPGLIGSLGIGFV